MTNQYQGASEFYHDCMHAGGEFYEYSNPHQSNASFSEPDASLRTTKRIPDEYIEWK